MKIELQGKSLRIANYNQHTFVDIREPKGYEHYAIQISAYDMHFVAILQQYSYVKELVVFPDKNWFDEWMATFKKEERPRIIKILTPKNRVKRKIG